MTGRIKFYDEEKKYGFIISDEKEYFFHKSNVNFGVSKNDKGANVSFELTEGRRGEQADKVKLI